MGSVFSERQWQGNIPIWRGPIPRPAFALLVLLVALSNPLACLVHCWVHSHSLPPTAREILPATSGHAHHAAQQATPAAAQPTNAQNLPTAGTFCRSDHQTPSPFTVAVLLPLLALAVWLAPSFDLPDRWLFLLFPALPPPRRPPRLASTTTP